MKGDFKMKCKYHRPNCKFFGNTQVCSECLGGIVWTGGYPDKEKTPKLPFISSNREWKRVLKELPIVSMRVWACWGPEEKNIAEMKCIVAYKGGKKTYSFFWRGVVSTWKVVYGQPYYVPEPPKFN